MGVAKLRVEPVPYRLHLDELLPEIRFALRQTIDVGERGLVILPSTIERGRCLAQLIGEPRALRRALSQLAIETALTIGEVGGAGDQRVLMLLLRIRERALGIGDRAFERGFCRAFALDLPIELRFAFCCTLAGREAIARGASGRIVECGLGGGQSTFEIGACLGEVGELRAQFRFTRKETVDVRLRVRQLR